MTDREMLELAAKAHGNIRRLEGCDSLMDDDAGKLWNPLRDSGDALELAVKLRINLLFDGGFHHVGINRHVTDVCRLGGIDDIRREIVMAAAEIGKAKEG